MSLVTGDDLANTGSESSLDRRSFWNQLSKAGVGVVPPPEWAALIPDSVVLGGVK